MSIINIQFTIYLNSHSSHTPLLNLYLLEPQLAHNFPRLLLPAALLHLADKVISSHSLKQPIKNNIISNHFIIILYLFVLLYAIC